MKGNPSVWRRSLARVIALAVAVTLAPLPLLAADQNTAPPGLKASAAKIASAERLVTPKPAQAKKDQGTTDASLQSGSFFKSPAGIVLLTVLTAGTAYALYSTSHDRVKSQAR